MPSPHGFSALADRLRSHLVQRIRSGEVSERSLARLTGYSQPHIHNVLKGKRGLSFDVADRILAVLNISALELLNGVEPLNQPEIPKWDTPVENGTELPRAEKTTYRVSSFAILGGLVRPVACVVAPGESAMWPWIHASDELIIDRSPLRRMALRVEDVFLIDWFGVGVFARCRKVSGSLVLVYANEGAPGYLPTRLDLGSRSVTDLVLGRVAWLSRRMEADSSQWSGLG